MPAASSNLSPVKSAAKADDAQHPAALKVRIIRALHLINPHLYSVNERIRDQARAFDPAVEPYILYACETRGKGLRPALALLSGGAAGGGVRAAHLDLAVILELIHVATLVHDDIIDGATKRRELATANARWGSSLSVLLGDCLFAHALKLATNFHNNEISRRIADAANRVCTGEILQTQRRFDLKLTIPEYMRIIEMKTAALFSVAGELGAFLSEADPDTISALKEFGLRLGIAYQIYDDCLDIAGSESDAGKTLGSDFYKGKLTLPVLSVLRKGSSELQERLRGLILQGGVDALDEAAEIVREQGGLTAAVSAAAQQIDEGCRALHVLPRSRYRRALLAVAAIVRERIENYSG